MVTTSSVSLSDKVKHFLSDPNDAPPYGYQDNIVTGVGFWLMQGARFSISVYENSSHADTICEKSLRKAQAIFIGIITLPLTTVGALMKGIGSQFPHKVENLTIDQIPKTPPHHVDQVYELLSILNTLLREKGITYSMLGGTMLGAVPERGGGMIPWDDDGDLFIMEKDAQNFLALKDRLASLGVTMTDGGLDAFRITFDEATLKNNYGVDPLHAAQVDIFLMKEDPDGEKIRFKSKFYQGQFPKEWFLSQEVQDLVDYPFGPPEKRLFLKGPREPKRYLTTFYGPECFQYALQTHSHIQLGPFSIPLLNFSKTRYKIVNPKYAEGNKWTTTR